MCAIASYSTSSTLQFSEAAVTEKSQRERQHVSWSLKHSCCVLFAVLAVIHMRRVLLLT